MAVVGESVLDRYRGERVCQQRNDVEPTPAPRDAVRENCRHGVEAVADADVYGALQTRQDLEADRLRRLNATTQFSVAQLLPNEEAMNVTLKGRLATFINGARTSDIDKEYVAEFEFKGNRVQIKNFKEIGNGESATKVSAATAGVGAAD